MGTITGRPSLRTLSLSRLRNNSDATRPRPRRRHRNYLLILLLLLTGVWLWFSTPTYQTAIRNSASTASKDRKFILFYNSYWGKPDFQFGLGHQPFLDNHCPVSNCETHSYATEFNRKNNLTMPWTNLSRYDAVLVSVQAHDRFSVLEHGDFIRQWRQPYQRFVFVMMESQAYDIRDLQSMNGFFNWTMTFRWDSDIPRPYGWFSPKHNTVDYATRPPDSWMVPTTANQQLALLARRPNKVAWVVSHCSTESRREDYVHQLQQYIPVDVFGKCSSLLMDRRRRQQQQVSCDLSYAESLASHDHDNCTSYIRQHYKFYLSFENQLCNDYVTEKFFGRVQDMVVIVLGQGNYSHVAPPHSYISIWDFDNPRALADYLHYLDTNDTAYLEYFAWQQSYQVHHPKSSKQTFGQAMCRLCEALHDGNQHGKQSLSSSSSYDDLYGWWRTSADCGQRWPSLQAQLRTGEGNWRYNPALGKNYVRPFPALKGGT